MPRFHYGKTIYFIVCVILIAVIRYTPASRSRFFSESREECLQSSDGTCSQARISSNPIISPNGTDICSDPPRGECTFYRECLESRFHCGEDGYPLGYGEKYCEKFSAGRNKLSPAGQEWMLNTMQCLQRALVSEAEGSKEFIVPLRGDRPESGASHDIPTVRGKKCDELKEKAFDSHAACYVDNGLCTLGVSDWAHIVEIISLKTLFGNWDAVKETLEAAEGCLEFYAFL